MSYKGVTILQCHPSSITRKGFGSIIAQSLEPCRADRERLLAWQDSRQDSRQVMMWPNTIGAWVEMTFKVTMKTSERSRI